MNQRIFDVHGMSCVNCAASLEKKFANEPDVNSCQVNFAAGLAIIDGDISNEKVAETAASLGFRAVPREDHQFDPALEIREHRVAILWLLVTSALGLPVVIIAMMMLQFPFSNELQALLSTIVVLVGGWRFHRGAWRLLLQRGANMDTLISVGTLTAWAWSLYSLLFAHHQHLYFESAVTITILVLIGKYLEERARLSAGSAIRDLVKLLPDSVTISAENNTASQELTLPALQKIIPMRFLRAGDRSITKPGERFSADGVVLAGRSLVDCSLITGESLPIELNIGDRVQSGTLNLRGVIEFQVSFAGRDATLGRMITAVESALGSKAPVARLADLVASRFVPIVLLIAFLTLIAWIVTGHDTSAAIQAAVAVLVVSCPCALGLATPMSIVVATGRAAQKGILVKDAAALELLHKANVIVFDKTGTLTTGEQAVSFVHWNPFSGEQKFQSLSKGDFAAMVHSLESSSSHPVARALTNWSATHTVQDANDLVILQIEERAGVGLSSKVRFRNEDFEVSIGKFAPMTNPLHEQFFEESKGAIPSLGAPTQVVLEVDGVIVALFGVADSLRDDAISSIEFLRTLGVEPIMATGDSPAAAALVAKELGIVWHAGMSPEQKERLIAELQDKGKIVAMAGDGMNDTIALAAADVGIAVGNAADVAGQVSGLALTAGRIGDLVEAIALSQATFRNIKQNLFWAFAYNVVLIPVAALGFLSPMLAAGSMACSSLFVVGNALRLKKIILVKR